MGFAAPLENFPWEHGLSDDPRFHDPQTLYMLDLTVSEGFRGKLGRALKSAIIQ